MRTDWRHERRDDHLAEIGENEWRGAQRRGALEASGEQLELRDTTRIERCDPEERGGQSSAERGESSRDESRDRGGRRCREEIAAGGADQAQHTRRADWREHGSAERTNQQVEHHAGGARYRTE